MAYDGKNIEEMPKMSHALTLTEREELSLSGVQEVLELNDGQIIVTTAKGELCIRGGGLRVEQLDKLTGQLRLNGRVDEMVYSRQPEGGFWARVLHG